MTHTESATYAGLDVLSACGRIRRIPGIATQLRWSDVRRLDGASTPVMPTTQIAVSPTCAHGGVLTLSASCAKTITWRVKAADGRDAAVLLSLASGSACRVRIDSPEGTKTLTLTAL